MTLQEIWALAQRLLDEGRDRKEVEQRVAELTQQATGVRMGLDMLAIQVGESPIQNPLRTAQSVIDVLPELAKAAPDIVRGLIGGAANLPKTIVDRLAEEGTDAVVDAAEAFVDFVGEDLGRYGVGGFADPGFAGGSRIGKRALRKMEKQVAKQRRAVRELDKQWHEEIAQAYGGRHVFATVGDPDAPGGWRLANREVDARWRQFQSEVLDPAQQELEQAEELLRNAKLGQPPVAPRELMPAGRPPIDPDLPVLGRLDAVRKNYVAAKGMDVGRTPKLQQVDEAYHQKWAEVYARATNEIGPETKQAWRAMADEVAEQYEWLTARPEEGGAGLRFVFTEEDPYRNHAEMLADLERGELKVFKTPDEGFHPYLNNTENDMFRAVHDALGHGIGRNDFELGGETQAAWQHLAMFSDEAKPAVAVETIGQNSAFHHGPTSGRFQEQKVFIPDERLVSVGYQKVDDVPLVRGLDEPAEAARAFELMDGSEDEILRLSMENGGSTFDPRGDGDLGGKDVWATSLGEKFERLYDEPPTPEEIRAFMDEHRDFLERNPNVVIGTWDDRAGRDAHGKFELNLTRTFQKQKDVRNYALAHDQWGYLNLADPEFESVAATDAFANARLRMRLDNEVPQRTERRLRRFRELATPDELAYFDKSNANVKQRILDYYSIMPETAEGAALAAIGHAGARWYESAASSIHQLFGDDAPRFSAVLAVLSPNAPVRNDLLASLDIWDKWVKAGRPTDRATLAGWLDEAKVTYGITPTNLNNLERVLNASDELLLEPETLSKGGLLVGSAQGPGIQEGKDLISGTKVGPFYGNLMGQLQRLVMDTHMRTGFGTMKPTVAAAGKAEVLAGQVASRGYAEYLTQLTGKPWDVGNVQAAQWSAIWALKEMAREGKAIGARRTALEGIPDILEGLGMGNYADRINARDLGELSEMIERVPSFGDLLHDDEAVELLARMGMEPPPAVPTDILDFLDDPTVRLGDAMEIARRLAQGTKDALPAAIAMLLGQGVLDHARGAELIDALADEAGIGDVRSAAAVDPEGTMDALFLMSEEPGVGDDRLRELGSVRGRPLMDNVISALRGKSQARPVNTARAGEAAESAAALRDSIRQIAGGGRFRESQIPRLLDRVNNLPEGTETAGIVFDLPFLNGIAQMNPQYVEDRGVVSHEGGHIVENLNPEEAAGINEALDVFIAGLDPERRAELGSEMVINRPADDEALREELFANLFSESLLTPDAPSSVEGTENVRQLMGQLINRKLNYPGLGE